MMINDPAAVWRLIQKADEVVKYAQNRDPAVAYAQAGAALDEAEAMLTGLDDAVATNFAEQIAIRRADLARATEA
jgi:hypothetical protein